MRGRRRSIAGRRTKRTMPNAVRISAPKQSGRQESRDVRTGSHSTILKRDFSCRGCGRVAKERCMNPAQAREFELEPRGDPGSLMSLADVGSGLS